MRDNLIGADTVVLGIQDFSGIAVWIVPVPAEEVFLLTMYLKGFSHGKVGAMVQMLWIMHGQLAMKPFYDSSAVLDVDTGLCEEVATQY